MTPEDHGQACKHCGHAASEHGARSGLCAASGCECEGFAGTGLQPWEIPEDRAAREATDMKRHAELWALADDENMRYLLVWQRVKKRAESGGFNGMLALDFRYADAALEALTAEEASRDR